MQFKKVGEKMEDTKTEVLNVFKSLEKAKAEPSEGSTFLKDRLVELRVCCYSDQSFNLSSSSSSTCLYSVVSYCWFQVTYSRKKSPVIVLNFFASWTSLVAVGHMYIYFRETCNLVGQKCRNWIQQNILLNSMKR